MTQQPVTAGIQAPLLEDPLTPGVVRYTLFAQDSVKKLSAEDFLLDREGAEIALKYDDCMLVLFYVENTESMEMVKLWSMIAQQVPSPIFAACNLLVDRRVAEAFTKIKENGSHPLHQYAMKGIPFILTYRKKWPVGFYNGGRETQAITDFALTLACQANYFEPIQLAGSMQAEAKHEVPITDNYVDFPGQPPRVRTESAQYTSTESIRGFDPKLSLVPTGSQQARQEAGVVASEEAKRRAGIATPAAPAGLAQRSVATPAAPTGLAQRV